jgi:photosystem II stability/assembly factor-like uncharacterized protein
MRTCSAILITALLAHPAGAVDLHDVTHFMSTYVAARSDGAAHRSGTGGVVYTVQPTGAPTPLRGVAYLSGFFVAVGDNGRIVRSSNLGLDWSNEDSQTSVDLHRVIAHDGLYLVAVGDGGTTLRRIGTAAVWDSTASPGGKALRDVASNGNILVAVGDDGTVLRSTDQGLTWNRQTLAGAPDLRGVTVRANASIFVAVGLGGRIVRSTNLGVDWEDVSSPTSQNLLDLAVDSNNFVAVGAAGTILRSNTNNAASGTWAVIDAGLATALRGAWHDGTRFYAVGDNEVVVRSFDGTAWIQTALQPSAWGDVKSLFRPAR